ncbi:ABC-2 type transport system permease protein [Nocardioides exalbidus]|uniref:ABC-2 type transport system permease protein n=1 Tax=Nocardioides exalbidus TaxID=402596 RepID=A0A1H4U8L1_9ACTN|nr:ABC transporter permease [Nocardioides exalbidus]SEC65023.1 ABC-2 type transport system permease protein [Nocardioides exalbidus]
MSQVSTGARSVEQRHDLAHVPLSPPSRTSGVLEVFRRRYLLRLLVRREIQARYAGTAFGLLWSYINPFTRFVTFYVVFGLILGRGLGIQNFAIHLFAGMVLVNYFTESVTAGTRSLLSNRGVITKMAMPREMFPVASMLVSLWHTIPQLLILLVACIATGVWGDGPLWVPDAVGMGAALLGFVLMMVYGTAFGLMFSCINVLFRDFQRIVQTFINMIPFTVPMMYPYYVIADGERIPTQYTQLYVSNPVAEAVMLIQRGFWYPTCDGPCATMPNPNGDGTLIPAPNFADHLFSRGFVMLGIGLVLLVVGQWVFSRLEKSITERL